MEWKRTRSVLAELQNLLTCVICKSYLKDPCTLDNCDHNFCRKCIEETLGNESKCPECGLFSWVKDLRLNHQLAMTVKMSLKLQSVIGVNMEVKNSTSPALPDSESSANTFTFASDKEMADEDCDETSGRQVEEKESSSSEECNIMKPDLKKSGEDRKTRSTKSLTTSCLKNNNESKLTRQKNKITSLPDFTIKDRESDSEESQLVSWSENIVNTKDSKENLGVKSSARKYSKMSKQRNATGLNRSTDTHSDNESHHASPVDSVRTENMNDIKHIRQEELHKGCRKQEDVTIDIESNSEVNQYTAKRKSRSSTLRRQKMTIKQTSDSRRVSTSKTINTSTTEESLSASKMKLRSNAGKSPRVRKKENEKIKKEGNGIIMTATNSEDEENDESSDRMSKRDSTDITQHSTLTKLTAKHGDLAEKEPNMTVHVYTKDSTSDSEYENIKQKRHQDVGQSALVKTNKAMNQLSNEKSLSIESDSEANLTISTTTANAELKHRLRTSVKRSTKKNKQQTILNTATDTDSEIEARNTSKATTKVHQQKSITEVKGRKNCTSERSEQNESMQNCRKKYSLRNPFDFTQQDDPFHFKGNDDNNNDSDDDHHDNYHDNDEDHDNHDSNDNDDTDGHSNLKSDQDKLTQGRKRQFKQKSNSLENHENDAIMHSTRSKSVILQTKIKSKIMPENSKKKVHFTHIKEKKRDDLNNQVEKENKKTSPKELNSCPTSKVLGVEDKENITLNVKRRRVRKRSSNIRQYFTSIDPIDCPEVSSDDALVPQKRKRSRNSSTSTCNSQNIINSSQCSQTAAGSSQIMRNKKGETPLHLAAIKGDLKLAHELINEGADPNVKDYAGWTPLHEACNHGHVDIVKLFLDNGALINIPGCDNDTPLHDAAANGRLKVVKLLVARGAILTTRNKQGLLPLDYALNKAMKAALTPRDVISSTKLTENIEDIKKFSVSCRESQVILGTALKTQDQVILKKCIKELGGTLIEEFDESVTHVVTSVNKNGHCPRTIKYLCGILTGKWIINFNWIKDSLREQEWLNEDVYEVEGTVGKSSSSTKKARLNSLQQMPRLLDGCSFFLRGIFEPPTPSKQDVIKLIELGGGKILHREPKVRDEDVRSFPSSPIVTSISCAPEVAYHAPANSTLSCCTEFILYDSMSCDHPKIVHSPVLRTAPVTWLMDCISSFELLDIPDV